MEPLSPAVFEILGSKHIGVTSFDLSGLRDVIGHVTVWYPICHFLLVVLWNQASISKRFSRHSTSNV